MLLRSRVLELSYHVNVNIVQAFERTRVVAGQFIIDGICIFKPEIKDLVLIFYERSVMTSV